MNYSMNWQIILQNEQASQQGQRGMRGTDDCNHQVQAKRTMKEKKCRKKGKENKL